MARTRGATFVAAAFLAVTQQPNVQSTGRYAFYGRAGAHSSWRNDRNRSTEGVSFLRQREVLPDAMKKLSEKPARMTRTKKRLLVSLVLVQPPNSCCEATQLGHPPFPDSKSTPKNTPRLAGLPHLSTGRRRMRVDPRSFSGRACAPAEIPSRSRSHALRSHPRSRRSRPPSVEDRSCPLAPTRQSFRNAHGAPAGGRDAIRVWARLPCFETGANHGNQRGNRRMATTRAWGCFPNGHFPLMGLFR